METTKVWFRKFPEGDVIAIFDIIEGPDDKRLSYQHIGQHGSCSPRLVDFLVPATPDEFSALERELIAKGYRLRIQ